MSLNFNSIKTRADLPEAHANAKTAEKVGKFKANVDARKTNMVQHRLQSLKSQKVLPLKVNVTSLGESDKNALIQNLTEKGYTVSNYVRARTTKANHSKPKVDSEPAETKAHDLAEENNGQPLAPKVKKQFIVIQ